MKYLVFIGCTISAFIIAPYLVLEMSETATTLGLAMVAADYVGTALAALVIGALGLLYKPNRFAGFVVGTFIAIGLMFAGANAQPMDLDCKTTDCQAYGI